MKQPKGDQIRAAIAVSDWIAALTIAATISHRKLGKNHTPISRAHQALVRPEWVRQLGRDPAADVAEGVRVLRLVFTSTKPAPVTPEAVAEALMSARWVFAKTMPHNPHEWTQVQDWRGSVSFDKAVTFIREHGYPLRHGTAVYRCLDVGPHRYWTMSPAPFARIINRAVNTPRQG